MLTGDTLSQWLQRRVGTVVYGPLVQLSPSGLLRVSDQPDSHQVRIALPVVYGGQAAVARAAVDGVGQALALRVQAVSSQTEKARQMERLVSMLTVAQAARTAPGAYPAVLPVLESFVVTAPGDEMSVTSPDARYELWCDLMPWCPSNLADHQQQTGPAGRAPSVVLPRIVPVIGTIDTVHRNLGIIHRDITPDNVLVDGAGRLLLADWGVAHAIAADQTSTYTEMVGNRGFSLPPEMVVGDQAVGRYTDAWYLGCLLVWMLTGLPPGPQHGADWLPPGLPGGRAGAHLDHVVRGLCWPDPRQRMNLADAAARLQQLASAGPAEWSGPPPARSPVAAGPPPPGGQAAPGLPSSSPRRSNVGLAALVSTLTVVVLVLAAVLAWVLTRPDQTAGGPTSAPASSGSTSDCWTDAASGECPAFDGAVAAYFVYRGYKDGVQAVCFPDQTPPEDGQFFLCGWEDVDLWARVAWFSDLDTMTDTYLNRGYEVSTDAPPFASGPDGTVFYHVHGETCEDDNDDSFAVYCFAELPICLEVNGTPDQPIPLITSYFSAIRPAQAHRIVEYLADQP